MRDDQVEVYSRDRTCAWVRSPYYDYRSRMYSTIGVPVL